MQEHPELRSLTEPLRSIKVYLLNYLTTNHSKIVSQTCVGEYPIDELISEQVEEEVMSLLKVVHRFKEDLSDLYGELQYGEPAMVEEPNDHAPKVGDDSKHWEGIETELKNDEQETVA